MNVFGGYRCCVAAFAAAAWILGSGLGWAESDSDAPPKGPGPQGCDVGEREMRFISGAHRQGHPIADAAFELSKAVNEALDGRLCLTVVVGELYVDNKEALSPVLEGEAELAAPFVHDLDGFAKAFRIFALPFVFQDQDAVAWFQNSGPGQRLKRELDGSGLVGLAYWNSGMVQLASNKTLLNPSDIAGAQVLTYGSAMEAEWLEAVGATPQVVVPERATEIIHNNGVDAAPGTFSSLHTGYVYLSFDGATHLDVYMMAHLLVANESFWSSLSQDDRRALVRQINRVSYWAKGNAIEYEKINRQTLEELEFRIWPPSAADKAAWVKAVQPLWRRYAKELGDSYLEAALQANR